MAVLSKHLLRLIYGSSNSLRRTFGRIYDHRGYYSKMYYKKCNVRSFCERNHRNNLHQAHVDKKS